MKRFFELQLFIKLAMTYMLMLTAYYFFEVDVIKQLANVFAIVIFGILSAYVVVVHGVVKMPASLKIPLLIFYVGMLASLMANGFSQDMAVFAKLLIGPAFIVLGYAMGRPASLMGYVPRNLYFPIAMLMGFPLALIAINVINGTYDFDSTAAVGIFANRNNAALYMISLLALLNSFHIKKMHSIIFALLVGLLFRTLGVLVAVVLALTYVFLSRANIKYALFVLLFVIAVYIIFPDAPIIFRLNAAYDSLKVLYDAGSGAIAQMTYGDLYNLTGTTDLSLFFRLKHWDEIFTLWGQSSLVNQLFGSGVGSAAQFTTTGLVPHNDYLRYFYECGVVAFLGFICLQFAVLKGIGRNHLSIPFVVITIYFVSENLVDNYLAMIIYYFSAGLILRQLAVARTSQINSNISRRNLLRVC